MPRGDVRDFMRHHARELRFFIRGKDQARVHVEEPAGKRKGVDLVGIHDFDGEGHLGIGIPHQVLADPVHVLGDHRILHHLHARLDLLGVSLTHADLALDRIPIARTLAGADVPVPDGGDVIARAVVLHVGRLGQILRRLGSQRILCIGLRSGIRFRGIRVVGGRRLLRRIRRAGWRCAVIGRIGCRGSSLRRVGVGL